MSAEWLSSFFENENKIDLAKVMAGGYGQVYQEMMDPLVLAASEKRWPVILPFNNDDGLRFYVAAPNERMLLELRQVLEANLGSADTIAELPIIKKATNSSEKVLMNYAPYGLIQVTLLDVAQNDFEAKQRIFRTLKRILSLYEQRPPLTEHIQRPLGRILREFFTACQVEDGKGAESLFQEIRLSGGLSQRNLLFLQYQSLATGQHWEAILNHEKLINCLSGRIPLPVTRVLLRALASRVHRLLHTGFSGVDVEQVRQNCQVLAPLFDKPPRLAELHNVTDEWKAWAIGAVLYGYSDVAKHTPAEIDSSWLDDLFSWAGVERSKQGVEGNNDYTGESGQFDLQRAKELLKFALLASPEETREIINELAAMPSQVAEQIKDIPVLYQHWMTLQQLHLPQHYGWLQWFADICEHEEQTEELRQLAMSECLEWPKSSFDSTAIQQILGVGGSSKTGEALRDVMPLMIEWLHDRNMTCTDQFWVKLLELLALDDFANQQDVQLAGTVLERLLSRSYSETSYEEALQAVEILLDKVNSAGSFDAVLELMDLLLEHPCPSVKSQQSLWLTIQQFAFHKWHRLSPLTRKLTLFSAREVLGAGAEAAFSGVLAQEESEQEAETHYPDLAGKTLAIYSLTEGATRRAKDILESLFDGLLVQINHDHVATSALKNLAEKAEYFIFAAKSAKHQAFYAVTSIRTDIIYPQGKGASSIVREFVSQTCKI